MPAAPKESTVLKRSIAMTLLVGATGVVFGILSGSLSIAFDGVFSVVDASMTGMALLVTQLIARDTSRRFQMGFWHFEPMVLAFNGGLLSLLSFYAFVNAVGTILDGGRALEFGWAIVYSFFVVVVCVVMALYGRRANRVIGSSFIALDVKGWTMSAAITAALLGAFIVAFALEGTAYAHWTPYVDPAILAVLTLCLIPVPLRTVVQAVHDILLLAPADLDALARRVADETVQRYGFLRAHTYVSKAGRSRMVEIHFVVPRDRMFGTIDAFDAVREEVGAAIGGAGPDRWLTVAFTGDEKWAV
ncbi:cation diffusion facilitator family transporter [Aureimonas sp. AU40]|uniref:cation diffusion facilitator family transporter n=1 Tax=Aureimonas sp. AU40 TaxID=1637747 RepID=UPI000780820A|nr:cation transporter [Aureimonas sp. AU40]